ncbi:MAG: hypothetical protein H6667_04225 [Ardenticatenaceae bacterium]|nr:hypothetical protein [Ardenticatenaceae bacterium]
MSIQEKKKLTLRVSTHLIEQAKIYAQKHNTSVSQLVEVFIRNLENDAEAEHTPLVRQLTGILPADIDVEETYHTHLEEKYDG